MSRHSFNDGGSNVQLAVGEQAGVKKLILFHHDPEHDDDFILNMEKESQKRFPNAFFAREGSTMEI